MNGTQKSQSTTNRLRCPACVTEIRETEPLSRLDIVYRCPVCRLDFVRDPQTHTLALAPLASFSVDTPAQGLPLNESRHTASVIDGSATPRNLIRERVPLDVDRAADEPKRRGRRRQAARPEPRERKRGPGS